ncbi:hypothetical protein DFH11DRAFT_1879301 [Phellopilus nigrolimitatus]|nr:hypothetical protein DFH11DRAFT_1879301 [Phellopilus nigrolimitatus]
MPLTLSASAPAARLSLTPSAAACPFPVAHPLAAASARALFVNACAGADGITDPESRAWGPRTAHCLGRSGAGTGCGCCCCRRARVIRVIVTESGGDGPLGEMERDPRGRACCWRWWGWDGGFGGGHWVSSKREKGKPSGYKNLERYGGRQEESAPKYRAVRLARAASAEELPVLEKSFWRLCMVVDALSTLMCVSEAANHGSAAWTGVLESKSAEPRGRERVRTGCVLGRRGHERIVSAQRARGSLDRDWLARDLGSPARHSHTTPARCPSPLVLQRSHTAQTTELTSY